MLARSSFDGRWLAAMVGYGGMLGVTSLGALFVAGFVPALAWLGAGMVGYVGLVAAWRGRARRDRDAVLQAELEARVTSLLASRGPSTAEAIASQLGAAHSEVEVVLQRLAAGGLRGVEAHLDEEHGRLLFAVPSRVRVEDPDAVVEPVEAARSTSRSARQ